MDLVQIDSKMMKLEKLRDAYNAFRDALDDVPASVRREILASVPEVKPTEKREVVSHPIMIPNGSHKKYKGAHAAVVGILTGRSLGLTRSEIVAASRGLFQTSSKQPDTVIYSEIKNMIGRKSAVLRNGKVVLA